MKDAKEIFCETISENTLNSENSTPHFAIKKQTKKTNNEVINREIKALREGEGAQKLLSNQPLEPTFGYKQVKARLGVNRVRPWKWTPFKNPAREDDSVFYHWARVGEESKPYAFAKFSQKIELPEFTDMEYWMHLDDGALSDWTIEETRHLLELCQRFDLRFVIIKVIVIM